ncbi:GPO family capsid scaffolding protein [Comamonas sp. JNW]|uniref:GPO family capsid scaffolding protein n=1 Tax=Comamonas sp. JNW TaxID=2170731 RepID=UPI000DE69BAE|nr:GPO family capsid scaffolding protein [Comamonas sp. JNW]PWB15636.1 phage capsid protein [Comamonas sp. JNW]
MPSKFFRVATEGQTTDGREITRAEIEQMGKSYNRQKYGARIWLEHHRGTVPGGPFDALGDVLATEVRDVEDGKKALFAQIEPLPTLIEMNKKGQKLYSSIEIHPNLPGTGGPYLFGLGVTDSPASLGTEVLKFSQGAAVNPFAGRKTDKATLYSEAIETDLGLQADEESMASGVLKKFSDLIDGFKGMVAAKPAAGDNTFAAQTVEALGVAQDAMQKQAKENADLLEKFNKQGDAFATLQQNFDALKAKLEGTENHSDKRPAATGKDASELADC